MTTGVNATEQVAYGGVTQRSGVQPPVQSILDCIFRSESRTRCTVPTRSTGGVIRADFVCKLCRTSCAWLRTLTSPDLVRSLICGIEETSPSSVEPLEIEVRSASRASSSMDSILFCFSVVLVRSIDLVEVGGGEHLAESLRGRWIAATCERDRGVVADEAVLVPLQSLAKDLGGGRPAEKAERHRRPVVAVREDRWPPPRRVRLIAWGSSSWPFMRPACLARLAAAAIRI